jgi:Na+/alanine symporter
MAEADRIRRLVRTRRASESVETTRETTDRERSEYGTIAPGKEQSATRDRSTDTAVEAMPTVLFELSLRELLIYSLSTFRTGAIAVVLFAFSTMISWSYYGERCWTYLFGDEQAMAFRFIFVFFVLLGSVSSLGNVLSFGDYFLLAMAFPNILGVVLLSDEIDEKLREYWSRYANGELERYD